MPRGKKTAGATKPAKQRNPRGAKAAQPAKPNGKNGNGGHTQDEKLAAAEAKLVQRYPNRKFKLGSLLPAGAVREFGHKRSIIILCEECGAERRVATSDVFHVRLCQDCKKPKKEGKK